MPSQVYTPADLAVRWNCSLDVVYDLLRSGRLRGFHVGQPVAYHRSSSREVREWRMRSGVLSLAGKEDMRFRRWVESGPFHEPIEQRSVG